MPHVPESRVERPQWWQHLQADLRQVRRGLWATPLFTAGVVLTLAVGIGAVASMFGTMRRLMLQPPPHVAAPEQVATLSFHYASPGDTGQTTLLSYPFFEQVRAHAGTLASVAAYIDDEVVVGSGPDAGRARATLVSAGFWRVMGARPGLGRFIADEEAHPVTGARVVVLGHAYWQRRFGGDPAVVGTTLRVKERPYRIVGVAPRGFRGVKLTDTDVWLPLFARGDGGGQPVRWHLSASSGNLEFVVRRRPDASPTQVETELSQEHAQFVARPDAWGQQQGRHTHVTLGPLTGALGRDGRRIPEATVTVWLVGVAGVLLAVACANVATLLLLRAARRRREIAVRLALGMSRGRLAALLFTESAVLALLGGAAAAAVVAVGGAWLRRLLLPGMLGESGGVDWATLAVSAGALVGTALLAGLVPVLQTPADVATALRDGAQQGGTRRSRVYWSLLVSQTALSAVLLVGAGLFLRSLHRVTTLDLGLDTEHSLVVGVDLTSTGRPDGQRVAFFERALERVRALPGVTGASLATSAPLRSATAYSFALRPLTRGEDVITDATGGAPFGNLVADGFFDAVGMRLVAGRGFTAADRTGPPVVVVNEALARRAWPGRSPLGECAYFDRSCTRVVGVARNAILFGLREEPRLTLYLPLTPADPAPRTLLVRVAPGTRAPEATLRRVLRELDPALPYVDVQRLGDALNPQLRPWRLGAAVFTLFGALAAALAALGLYTAMAYAVTQRTREIGVRIALGAPPPGILWLVLRDAFRVAGAGVVVGLAVAMGGGGWIADLLFDTSPREPTVLTAVGLALLGVAALACVAPARRAARVNPTEALRAE